MQKSKLGIVGIGVFSFFFSSFLFAMGPDNNCKGLFTSNAYQALPSMVREDGDNYYWTTKDGRYLLFLTPRNLALLQPGTVIEDSIGERYLVGKSPAIEKFLSSNPHPDSISRIGPWWGLEIDRSTYMRLLEVADKRLGKFEAPLVIPKDRFSTYCLEAGDTAEKHARNFPKGALIKVSLRKDARLVKGFVVGFILEGILIKDAQGQVHTLDLEKGLLFENQALENYHSQAGGLGIYEISVSRLRN